MTATAEADLLARVALNALTEPGDPRVARLLSVMTAPELLDRLLHETRADRDGLGADTAPRADGVQPERIVEQALAIGLRFVVPGDPEWVPALAGLDHVEPLNRMAGAPVGLWLKGPLRLAEICARSVAVVGSRSATTYGTAVAADLAAGTAGAGVSVISGAAFGIDQAAHRGALGAGGVTVAVLACGLDRVYPAAHRALIEHIAEHGLLVSELPPGCAPTRVRFLGRNRIIAALSQGTVVVEAAVRSGALNTATWAGRLQRVVMGVPGPVTSAPSEGVHELLRRGEAVLVSRPEHVLEAISPHGEHLAPVPRAEPRPWDGLDPDRRRVLEAVPLMRGAPVVSIARTAGVAESAAATALEALVAAGLVEASDGRFRRSGGAAG